MTTTTEPEITAETISQKGDSPAPTEVATEAPETTETTEVASETTTAPSSLVLAHLQEYPTVNAAYTYAASLPLVQKAASYTLPYVEAAKERGQPFIQRASPVLAKADALGDRVLTTVDSKFTGLKTTQPEDVLDLAKKPIETIRSTADAYKAAANERVVKPIQEKVHERAESVNTNVVDPLLKPVNEKFESVINTYLPATDDKESEEEVSKHELGRAVQLTKTAVKRAKPVIATQVNSTKAHVQQVYDSKHEEYAKGTAGGVQTTVYASIATARQLSTESVALVGSVIHQPKQ